MREENSKNSYFDCLMGEEGEGRNRFGEFEERRFGTSFGEERNSVGRKKGTNSVGKKREEGNEFGG